MRTNTESLARAPLDSDVASLISGDLSMIAVGLQALELHLKNHGIELPLEAMDRLYELVEAKHLVTACQCEVGGCQEFGAIERGENSRYGIVQVYCERHQDQDWARCESCDRDTLKCDMTAVDEVDVCIGCYEAGAR
jgi:hypothetical protein